MSRARKPPATARDNASAHAIRALTWSAQRRRYGVQRPASRPSSVSVGPAHATSANLSARPTHELPLPCQVYGPERGVPVVRRPGWHILCSQVAGRDRLDGAADAPGPVGGGAPGHPLAAAGLADPVAPAPEGTPPTSEGVGVAPLPLVAAGGVDVLATMQPERNIVGLRGGAARRTVGRLPACYRHEHLPAFLAAPDSHQVVVEPQALF